MELRDISPDRTWPTCPMYDAIVEALVALHMSDDIEGLPLPSEARSEALETDPREWKPRHWPSPDRAIRDRFHAEWTRRLQARFNIDPLTQPKNTGANGTAARKRHTVRDKVLAALDDKEALLPEVVALHADHPVRQTHWSLLALYRDGLIEREVVECATTTTRPGWKYKKLYAYRKAA